jgi:hypothetical protein
MGLLEQEVLSICENATKELFGENLTYEHVHTTYFTDNAYGLIEVEEGTKLISFELDGNTVEKCTPLHTFASNILSIKPLIEKLIQIGRDFGNNEKF